MNLLHLKYAVEVERTHSLSKAAENLFVSQPNLSRSVKDLEESLGITIFKRTTKGMFPMPQGEEFLNYARDILSQIDRVESLYRRDGDGKQRFTISVPRASYISDAFVSFSRQLDPARPMEVYYKETNAMRAITNIMQEDYNLGIIRYQSGFEQYFSTMLYEKGLKSQAVWEFHFQALMSKTHPLADRKEVTLAELSQYTEIAHGDPYVPSMPIADVKKAELSDLVTRRIFIFERGSQFELLSEVEGTYMMVSPMPQKTLNRYGLVQKSCSSFERKYKDVLIYRKGYRFTELDQMFIEALERSKASVQL